MFSRLVAGLLLKSGLSLGLLLGIAAYALYLAGGDPGALWKRLAGNAVDSVTGSLAGLGDRVDLSGTNGGARALDRVWTWRDASGQTHYATTAPAGVAASRIELDPNVNVLAPVTAPTRTVPRAGGAAAGDATVATGAAVAAAGAAEERAVPLPGIGGALTRARGETPAVDPERAAALLRMLQTPSR